MDEQSFNKQLARIAPDLRLLYNNQRRLWGIYQIRARNIILTSGGETKPWLLWDVVDVDENNAKTFRLPDNRDLGRAAASVSSGHAMWTRGNDWYNDKIEAQEQERIDAARQRTDTHLREAVRDHAFHTKVATNSTRRRGTGV